MDVRSGQIYSHQDIQEALDRGAELSPDGIELANRARARQLAIEDLKYLRPMGYDPTPEQRATGRVGRNDVCPCGSGKKFKKCCLWRKNRLQAEADAKRKSNKLKELLNKSREKRLAK